MYACIEPEPNRCAPLDDETYDWVDDPDLSWGELMSRFEQLTPDAQRQAGQVEA